MSLFHPIQRRKARKTYKCWWCGQQIERGLPYDRQTGVYEGAWFDSKMHPECSQACLDGQEEYLPFCNERPESAK